MTKDLITLENYNPDEYKNLLRKTQFGESNYCDKNFKVKEQLTPHRQLRQILMNYDGICYTLLTCQNKQKESDIEKREFLNKIEELEDAIDRNTTLPTKLNVKREMTIFDIKAYELKIQKLELKVKEKELGESQSNKLIEDALNTKESFENILSELIPKVEALEKKGIDFEEAEKEYWKRRFTEEARLDIFIKENHIPISKETLKAIFRLDKETRKETLKDLGIPYELMDQLGLDFQEIDKKLLMENKVLNIMR